MYNLSDIFVRARLIETRQVNKYAPEYPSGIPQFSNCAFCVKYLKNKKRDSSDLFPCSSKLAVVVELRFRKTVCLSELIMCMEEYIFVCISF